MKDLYFDSEQKQIELQNSKNYLSWNLTHRQLCDIELILNGAFLPLKGFLSKADYESVIDNMRLSNGALWPIPITLDVDEKFSKSIHLAESIALRDSEGILIAVMTVTDIWRPDKQYEAKHVFGTKDDTHPAVYYLLHQAGNYYLGGEIHGVMTPCHYDFNEYRHSPETMRALISKKGWSRVIAFQTRNPLHRVHFEMTRQACLQYNAKLVIHPVVGLTKPGDINHYSRVRCYEYIIKKYPDNTALLSLLPLAMRMGGPREALLHAIVRKNYGFTHMIVGRDHAGPGKDKQGNDFYEPYEAQMLFKEYQSELEIEMIPFKAMVYSKTYSIYKSINEVGRSEKTATISGTDFRNRLQSGNDIPDWFSYPEIIHELRKRYPPKHKQGFTVFFTGLSGAGKSTIANALMVKLLTFNERQVSLLDGDHIRRHLSSELGFSKEHRDLNILRIGYVASEITKNGGIAICAPIAPYSETRRKVRAMIEAYGGFIEIYLSTPIKICEQRDRKGLYAKARAGIIKNFTGIDDPYEIPEAAEHSLDTTNCSPEQAIQQILSTLKNLGFYRDASYND